MARSTPNVFTIAPGEDFATLVVRHLLDGTLTGSPFADDPLALADTVIHVPTRRFRPALEAAFAKALAPRAVLLPRIRPLAEPDEIAELATLSTDDTGSDFLAPAISPMRRRFLLLPMVSRWRGLVMREAGMARDTSFRDDLALANALGALIDEFRIADVPLNALTHAAPPGYDSARHDLYWEKTREFLAIAATFWPQALTEIGCRDAMDIRLAALEAEAARLAASDPAQTHLVIGSTGSIPATRKLMRAVARLERGAVVLPGLDLDLDARSWAAIGNEESSIASRFGHPQAMLKRTLETIGLPREGARALTGSKGASPRNKVISDALRPAETVATWRESSAALDIDAALTSIRVIEAADEREEALAIAVTIREALNTPEGRIALVTPDRNLAQRVRVELARWGIEAADTAGTPLLESSLGLFIRLVLAAASEAHGVRILALARHPMFRLGFSVEMAAQLADALDLVVFRERQFTAGMALAERVRHALANPPERPHLALSRLDPSIVALLPEFARAFDDALAPFRNAKPARLADLLADLGLTIEQLGRDGSGQSTIEQSPDAAILADLLDEIGGNAGETEISPLMLADLVETFLSEKTIPPSAERTPQVAIMGTLESRLLALDRVILGGLNEGVFPPAAQDDPFLNRAMRHELGLSPPERRIGQSAHDFQMLAGIPHLTLTRARRVGGQPGLASRFLRRLEAYAGATNWTAITARGAVFLDLARRLDAPKSYMPIHAPDPRPAAPRIPPRLSITEIETLRRDPYALYARHILQLTPLGSIEPEPDARERGTILHACLDAYCRAGPPADPEAGYQMLREIAARLFAPIAKEPERFSFWWRAFERIVPDFIAFDHARRRAGYAIVTETRGRLALRIDPSDEVLLSGKADRIEVGPDGKAFVLDYKSSVPGNLQVLSGLSPQLPITAAMLMRGAFPEINPISATRGIARLGYVPVGGAKPLRPEWIKPEKDETLEALIEQNWARLVRELSRLAKGDEGYRSRIAPTNRHLAGDYDHLARVGEWGIAGDMSEEASEDEA